MTRGFKDKLARGDCVVVLNADHPAPSLVERIGRLPVDAVFIDCEQGSPDVETVENMARAARLTGMTSLVRLFDRSDWVIERYLGRGVDGIVVPRLESADQAAAVVDAVRYCFPHAHAEKVVVVQIETRRALATLDDFIALSGIDVLFLGPVDLAKSLGYAGDHSQPEVQMALKQAVERIASGGKVAGILVDRSNAADWVGAGARFLYEHVDNFLALGAAEFTGCVAAARSKPTRTSAPGRTAPQ
jgi:2-keto-3-deoxy-L-rhamnonate aldolase RhmA